jgi:hypothetical protein
MRHPEVIQDLQRLKNLFSRIKDFSGDTELQAYWTQFLCVRASGFIENSIRNIFGEYARTHADTYVANYVRRELDSFQNAKSDKILQLTSTFNPEWRTQLEVYIKDKRKDAIDSIVNNRNQIAHGRSVGISYHILNDYFRSSVEVVEYIDQLLQ